MRFAKNSQHDTSKARRLPHKMTMDASKVLRLPRKLQLILRKRRKSIAPATRTDFRHVTKHVWMSRSTTPTTRNEATRPLSPPKITPSSELTIGTAIWPSRGRLQTVAEGCGRLRTVGQRRANTPSTPRPPEWNGNPCYAFGKNAATKKQRRISGDPGILEELQCQCLADGSFRTPSVPSTATQPVPVPFVSCFTVSVLIFSEIQPFSLDVSTLNRFWREDLERKFWERTSTLSLDLVTNQAEMISNDHGLAIECWCHDICHGMCSQKSWALNSSCRPSPTAAIVASNLGTPEATQIGLGKSETRLVEF